MFIFYGYMSVSCWHLGCLTFSCMFMTVWVFSIGFVFIWQRHSLCINVDFLWLHVMAHNFARAILPLLISSVLCGWWMFDWCVCFPRSWLIGLCVPLLVDWQTCVCFSFFHGSWLMDICVCFHHQNHGEDTLVCVPMQIDWQTCVCLFPSPEPQLKTH